MTIPQKQTDHITLRQREHPAFKYFIRTGILVKLISAFFLLVLINYYL
jgi:hypothetical protein